MNAWNQYYKKNGRVLIRPHEDIKRFARLLLSENGKHVLDLGSGGGRNAITLAENGFNVTAVESQPHPAHLISTWARQRNVPVKVHLHNIHHALPFHSNTFDGVVGLNSFVYEAKTDVLFTVSEILRVLKRTGIALLSFPSNLAKLPITHLIYNEEELHEIISKNFQIIARRLDEENSLSFLLRTI